MLSLGNLRATITGLPWSSELDVILATNLEKEVIYISMIKYVCDCVFLCSIVRGPGVFGEVQIYWNITPASVSEFETVFGIVAMSDGQSVATILLKVSILL